MNKLESIREVIYEFSSQFLSKAVQKAFQDTGETRPFIAMTDYRGTLKQVLVRYYKKGDEFNTEDDYNYYPVISIQDFAPDYDKSRGFGVDTIDGDYVEENGIVISGDLISLPIPYNFKFQISFAGNTQADYDMFETWFHNNFSTFNGACFTFKTDVIVNYTYKNLPGGERNDNKFESIKEFNLNTWIWFKVNVTNTEDIIQTIKFVLKQQEETTGEEFYLQIPGD